MTFFFLPYVVHQNSIFQESCENVSTAVRQDQSRPFPQKKGSIFGKTRNGAIFCCCAGQDPLRELVEGLTVPYHLIGGADVASELDAKAAINQGTRLAAAI